MKNKFLKLMALFVASAFVGNAWAQASYNISYTEGVEVAEGDYFLYNVGSKAFLVDGMDWGTHATADHAGRVVTLAKVSEEPVAFSIFTKSFTSSDKAGYMTLNGYLDTGTNDANWVFSPVELEGYTNAYTIKHSDTQFLYYNFDDMRVNVGESTSDNYSYWILIPREARNAAKDYTYLLQNTDFNRPWERSIWTCAAGLTNKSGGLNSNRCAEVYRKTFDMYQNVNGTIENGKYVLYNQGFYKNDDDSSPAAYLYANDSESTFAFMNTNSENTAANMDGASTSFNAGHYVNSVTTIVTNNTLKIGVKNDNALNWVIFDNFFLSYLGTTLLNDAVAFTNGIELEAGKWYCYDVAQPTEFKIQGSVALNDIVYTTDGELLTEEANSNVASNFQEEQTLAAGTYYFKSATAQTLSITPNVLPTTVTLSATEVALNAASNTIELTATVGEAGAPQDIVWTSTNADVATVVNGVVTGVTPGSTVVRATAYGYDDVYAEATVTVTYAETVVEDYHINDGAKRTIYTHTSANTIKNGTFDYPEYYGWKNAANSNLTASKFEILSEENGNKYLHGKTNEGSNAEGSIATSWSIEAGKTYEFGYRTKGNAGNTDYHKVSLTNNETTENTDKIISKTLTLTTNWQHVRYQFTNTDGFAYLHFRARWLGNNTDFDDFYLCEVTTSEEGNVDYITENVPTANIGEGAFQYSQANIDAAKSLVQGEATVEDVQNAYDAMMVLNTPDEEARYVFTFHNDAHDANGNAITLIEGGGNSNQGGYGLKYLTPTNANYAQAFALTKATGTNCYYLSQTNINGESVYLTTATLGYNANNYHAGLRFTTDDTKALEVQIQATATEGHYVLYNTLAQAAIAHNGNTNNDAFTKNSATFTISEAEQAEVTLIVKETGWATLILPFNAEISDDITLYSCTEVGENNELVLVEAESIVANTPYIVKGVEGATTTYDFAGYGLATADTYTEGLLTGTYVQTTATANTYVLQNHDGKVAFYLVGEVLPEIGANRCFLTVPAESAGAPMFSLERGEGTTSIENAELTNETVVIYDLAGRRVEKMEKGIYIVNGRKVIR